LFNCHTFSPVRASSSFQLNGAFIENVESIWGYDLAVFVCRTCRLWRVTTARDTCPHLAFAAAEDAKGRRETVLSMRINVFLSNWHPLALESESEFLVGPATGWHLVILRQ
jgi:hypothetical protein